MAARKNDSSVKRTKRSARAENRNGSTSNGVLSHSELAADIADEIVRAVQRERELLYGAIHDGPLQAILLARLLIEKLSGQTNRPSEFTNTRRLLTKCLNESVRDIRKVTRGIYDEPRSSAALVRALHRLARQTNKRFGVTCVATCHHPMRMSATTAAQLCGIAREAVANAARHSQANRISIHLAAGHGSIELRVRDNGIGLRLPLSSGPGMGLRLMSYRAASIGAEISIRNASPKGTEVVCVVREPQKSRNPIPYEQTKEDGRTPAIRVRRRRSSPFP